jgi:glycerol-3-phosphate acyltransferase PlsX
VAVRIALDAMGGDLAPDAPVRAAVLAVEQRAGALEVLLVGPEREIETALAAAGGAAAGVRVVPSGPGVPEGGHPASWMRRHADNSVQTAARLAAEGRAEATVAMGHTGGCLIAASWEMGLLPGVERPAPAVAFAFAPDMTFLDAGANPDPGPTELVQFARMGAAYARAQFGIAEPTIALLSNGAERGKGNRVVQAAHELLLSSGLRFVGNCEGGDLMRRPADVIVADGFTGNCVLKAIEGMGAYMAERVRDRLPFDLPDRDAILAALGVMDDATQSGAPVALLGVDGVFVPGHGRSSAEAICQTLIRTESIVRSGFRDGLRAALGAAARHEGATSA